jgi:hypothetical protein
MRVVRRFGYFHNNIPDIIMWQGSSALYLLGEEKYRFIFRNYDNRSQLPIFLHL